MDKKLERLIASTAILLLITMFLPTSFAFGFSDYKTIEQHDKKSLESQSIPIIEDPTPGYWETSEFLNGSVAVGIILPESNGTIDPETEDWNSTEIANVNSQIKYAFNWWASQNLNASVRFINETHITSIRYEAANRLDNWGPWVNDTMTYLGHPSLGRHWTYQVRDYTNDLRERLETEWAFTIFVVDNSNNISQVLGKANTGGPAVYMTYLFPNWDIEDMHRAYAHEIGHIFMARDEKSEKLIYGGYLNVSNVPQSGCLMDDNTLCLSGATHGHNGTWGQVGWRDTDGDGIQDIVDTIPLVYLNPSERIGNTLNYTGVAAVTPYPNKNPKGQRNVTINKIQNIQYCIDNGTWLNATTKPTTIERLIRYPDTYVTKNTTAVMDFNFTTPPLEPGEHFIEIKAINSVGNEGYANDTVTIPDITHDIAITNINVSKTVAGQGYNVSIDVTLENQGNVSETFDVTIYANTTEIETKEITLSNGSSTEIGFIWNTEGFDRYKNYTISANATIIPGEIDTDDNTFINGIVTVVIPGDVDGDKDVDLYDAVKLLVIYGVKKDNQKYDPNCDIDGDGDIDLYDAVILLTHYGQKET